MKRGNPTTLTPAVEAEMERLWSRTTMGRDAIADEINERFGTAFTGRKIEWHARRRAWNRSVISKSFNHRSIIEERLFTRSWERWANPRPEDNPVKRVPPGTHAAGGFSMIGGSLR